MVFCSCSFSLMFYGINFLWPTSGCFLYLVSKGRSTGCARNDNSVSFHHAIFAHQCRNSEKYGINFFPDYKTKTESFYLPVFINRNLSFLIFIICDKYFYSPIFSTSSFTCIVCNGFAISFFHLLLCCLFLYQRF